ncbi:MAG: efflux RND transporter periplasmic adaptor subunit [Bacteroidales bacterium]|nr:efflux RND transporter periplasmic adaptor subunit [Bacteroidales bacterium]
MKKIIFLLLIIIFTACQSTDSPEAIKEKIQGYKNDISELNHKIDKLEEELNKYSNDNESKHKIPVSVLKLEYQKFNHFLEASGSVESINEAFISPEINGQIKKIYVTEGVRVKKGDLLVKINTSITENTINEVKTSLELATTVYEKQKQLWEKKIGSELQFLEAKNNKESLENKLNTLNAQLEMALIKSPIDGIVDEIFQKEGELGLPGIQLMQIINLDKLYINIDVSEAYLSNINKGDMVTLEFPAYPEIKIKVPIHRIGNVVKPENRTFTVQLKINNLEEKLKPNILSVIKINDFSTDSALVVPSIIIKQDFNGSYVYVAKNQSENMIAKKVYVKTGMSDGSNTMITEGLNPGQMVITKGYNLVKNGTEIKLI